MCRFAIRSKRSKPEIDVEHTHPIAKGPTMVFHILPRGMRYAVASATSIDLFVCEVAAYSRFRIEVVAEHAGQPLQAPAVHNLPRFDFAGTWRRARIVTALARRRKPALLLVQQHFPSAVAIRKRVDVPVILQRHNFMRPPREGRLFGKLWLQHRVRQFNLLAGLTFVSAAALGQFERDWPQVTTPRRVIPNGIDFTNWNPREVREKLVLVVGRATPEKGLLEAAQALARALPRHKDWSAIFVVSEPEANPTYFEALRMATKPLGERAQILASMPFAEVKALNERAAISVIPSKWREPFGRTCLEAHAGGAAVISSGSGGLKEISGDAAVYTPIVDSENLFEALTILMSDEEKRYSLACEGSERVRRLFDLRRIAGDLDDFCAQAMQDGGCG